MKSSVWYVLTLVVVGGGIGLFLLRNRQDAPAAPALTVPRDVVSDIVAEQSSAAGKSDVKVYTYEVVHAWPHDRKAFTQGLVFRDGIFLESTGQNGQSSLRKVELESGRVLQQESLPFQIFAEGLAELGGKLFQLTWQNGKCFVYGLETFRREKEFSYTGEGWGLTTDGQVLIMSDGTERLVFRDPRSFEIKKELTVTARGQPIYQLNELEYVKGEIWANIWQTQYIVRIDPGSGKVVGVIDLTGILPANERDLTTDVLNGIAYDAAKDRVFVTGKYWPKLFEIKVKARN